MIDSHAGVNKACSMWCFVSQVIKMHNWSGMQKIQTDCAQYAVLACYTRSSKNLFVVVNMGKAGSAGPSRYIQKQSTVSKQFDHVLI